MSGLKQGSYTRTEGRQSPGTYAIFKFAEVEDPVASEREGRPIFRLEERVEITFTGNPFTKPEFKVTREHIERWPEEYKAFQAGQEVAVNGTPLEQWPILKRNQISELKALHFRTVEDVAAMNDHAVQRIGMGGRRLRDLAIAYLDDAKAGAIISQATAANERHEQTIAEQNAKIENLSSLCERLSSQLIALQNAPSPIATYVPGQHDPAEAFRQARPQEEAAPSSLLALPEPRKRGKAAAEGAPS